MIISIPEIIGLLFVSISMIRAQVAIASFNYGSSFNGIGAVPKILLKTSVSPTLYRVLMGYILKFIPVPYWNVAYESVMVLGLWAVLLTTSYFYGVLAAVILASLLGLTYKFDYWCWIPELGAAVAATSGNLWFTIPWTILLGLSKETVHIVPIIFLCYGGSIYYSLLLLLLSTALYFSVRKIQGFRAIYCERFPLDRNGKDLQDWFKVKFKNLFLRSEMTSTVIITASCILSCCHLGFPKCIPWLLILAAGWILAVAEETRVFTICLIPLVLWFIN